MKVEDLRFGNSVFITEEIKRELEEDEEIYSSFSVIEIKDDEVTISSPEGIIHTEYYIKDTLKEIIPIELTEDSFLRLRLENLNGFKFKHFEHQDGYCIKLYFRIVFKFIDGSCALFIDGNDWSVELKYVHQIQNLFRFLVGEELVLQD